MKLSLVSLTINHFLTHESNAMPIVALILQQFRFDIVRVFIGGYLNPRIQKNLQFSCQYTAFQ